jgi:hypothetical protein
LCTHLNQLVTSYLKKITDVVLFPFKALFPACEALKTTQKSLKNYCFACLEKALAAFIEKNKVQSLQ